MKRLSLAMLPVLAAACTDSSSGPSSPAPLTIEGHIDSEGYVSVLLTSSIIPSDEGGPLADAVIRWGKVSLSDGETTVILTGGPDRNYVPPYRYFNHSMEGKPGRTYTITAEYEGRKATSTCTMPRPTPIDSLTAGRVEGNDTLRTVTVHFTAPDDCPAYYHLSTRALGIDPRYYPAMLGCVIASTPGENISLPAYRGKHFSATTDFSPQWPEGCTAMVKLERVSEEVYRFWDAYNNMVLFGGSQFTETPESLPGNVSGGYGVWSAQGTDVMTIRLQ